MKSETEGSNSGDSPKGGLFRFLHDVFLASLAIKGLNALVELASSLILFLFSVQKLRSIVDYLARLGDVRWLHRYWPMIFYRLERWVAPDTKSFFSWFFLSHGAVKAFIVACLLCGWMWAYPLGISVFLCFIAYQIFEIARGQHSTLYIALTALDLFVICLTANEWRHAVRAKRGE
jgi:uncharacterized membrane protein